MNRPSWYVNLKDESVVGTLNNEFGDLWRKVKSRGRTQVFHVTIPTTGIDISHRLGRRPKEVRVQLRADSFANATWWEEQEANSKYVYLKADLEVEATVTLVG
jgi:hypothetical protein